MPRQYATFAGTAYGHTVSRFFDKLVRRGYATACDCLHNRAELYHVRHPALYRAIDQPHSRYRRPVPARQVIDRLMRLDAIVLQPGLVWLATEEEKVAFFSLMAPLLPRERLPHVMVGKGAGRRLRLFPEDQPIGVTSTGRVVFTYLVTAYDAEPLRAFVQRHADLLRALPGWTLPLVLPQQLADARTRFEGVVRDELTPLRPELLAELKRYFRKRRSTLSRYEISSRRHRRTIDARVIITRVPSPPFTSCQASIVRPPPTRRLTRRDGRDRRSATNRISLRTVTFRSRRRS